MATLTSGPAIATSSSWRGFSGIRSIADALMSPEPGILPFEIHKRRVKGGFTATNDQLLDAMSYAFHNLKLVVEPGGANALAVLLNNRAHFAGRGPVLLVLSGGNVDADVFSQAIARTPPV